MSFRTRMFIAGALVLLCTAAGVVYLLAVKEAPESVTYGMSFNTFYAEDLGLPWREVYDAYLDDLGVRHLRLAAHWTMVEPEKDAYDFRALDYQMRRAEEVGADVIFGVGRRLPRWPECHVPEWAQKLAWEAQKEEIREYIVAVVERYKNSPALKYWQVENEPYLGYFAHEHCGDLDEAFLEEEVSFVRMLDPGHKIMMTESGEQNSWFGSHKHADITGISVYLYLWNPIFGRIETFLPPWFYRAKEGIVEALLGEKEVIISELSAEPWLLTPIQDTDLETQFLQMDLERVNRVIEYARQTQFDTQYLWGGEWWYWLKEEKDHPEIWERGKELFKRS